MAKSTSGAPKKVGDEAARLSDVHKLTKSASWIAKETVSIAFCSTATSSGETESKRQRSFFDSLKADEKARVTDVQAKLKKSGCVEVATVRHARRRLV